MRRAIDLDNLILTMALLSLPLNSKPSEAYSMSLEILSQHRSGQLKGQSKVSINAGLTEFPRELLELADSLEVLDLSGNCLRSLPDDFDRLQKLKILFISQNDFEIFPEVLGRCSELSMVGFKANKIRVVPENALPPLLRWLILTDNQIEVLPESIGKCDRLQKLMLAGNRLNALPESMRDCRALELVRLAANRFESLPDWLVELPRLGWIGMGGAEDVEDLGDRGVTGDRSLQWRDFQVGDRLGEGASGIISRAVWQGEAVAVKVFKGAVTSDGLPEDEMRVCMAAGLHENLVGVLGEVIDHPEGQMVLALPLLDEGFKILGGPPSFESCTRDTFAADRTFDSTFILQVARGIASVAKHLHDRGIMHGDLYAHNILVDQSGKPVLSDFGAASFYPVGSNWEYLEVRSFGCLLEDLLDRYYEPKESEIIIKLRELQHDCLNEIVCDRPRFEDICQRLD